MLPAIKYKKSRLIYETFRLLKTGQANTKFELAHSLDTKEENIENYIAELNSDFGTDIKYDKKQKKYVIEHEGVMGLLKNNSILTADDAIIILFTMVNSQSFMETKINIIKNSLLNLLPEEEARRLRDMFHFEKSTEIYERSIEYNIEAIRKAITEEKKITFTYRSGSKKRSFQKVIPYSFASELGKLYVIAKPEGADKLTHYRIDRIFGVNISDEEGKRQEKFNINDYMRKTWFMYTGSEVKVIVRFASKSKTVVTERNMIAGKMLEEDEHHFTYEFMCNGYRGIKLWLMTFGGDAEVLEPIELREEIKQAINDMAKVYGI